MEPLGWGMLPVFKATPIGSLPEWAERLRREGLAAEVRVQMALGGDEFEEHGLPEPADGTDRSDRLPPAA